MDIQFDLPQYFVLLFMQSLNTCAIVAKSSLLQWEQIGCDGDEPTIAPNVLNHRY